MKRRSVLGAALAASVPVWSVSGVNVAHAGPASPLEGPPTVTPKDLTFTPRRLRRGSPRQAGLTGKYIDRVAEDAASFMEPGPGGENPAHPGFVVLAARKGVIVTHDSGGHLLRYESYDPDTDTAVELPADKQEPMGTDAIFDMASVSKLFTAMVATTMAAEGTLDLEAKVATYLPEFAKTDPDKAPITLMHMMRHVSGLKPSINLWKLPDDEARMKAIYESDLDFEPDTDYAYSDLNFILLGKVIEAVTGNGLDAEVAARITEPLGMPDTGYNPSESKLDRIAATEYKPDLDRGMIRGIVHDENAWSFSGVAGHAGVFSTAADMARFGQMILNGGELEGTRLLDETWVRRLLTNYSPDLGESAARGYGWQLGQRFYMDGLSSPVTAGHTGFTGTSIVLDPMSESMYILLTNRVHPTRNWGETSEYRRLPARDIARAVPVKPRSLKAWYAGLANETTATLTVPLDEKLAAGSVKFKLWYDTEDGYDEGCLEASSDGESYSPVKLHVTAGDYEWDVTKFSGFAARQWTDVTGKLAEGTKFVRWSYATDTAQLGRGVYVDKVRIFDGDSKVFDGERWWDSKRFESDGWEEAFD